MASQRDSESRRQAALANSDNRCPACGRVLVEEDSQFLVDYYEAMDREVALKQGTPLPEEIDAMMMADEEERLACNVYIPGIEIEVAEDLAGMRRFKMPLGLHVGEKLEANEVTRVVRYGIMVWRYMKRKGMEDKEVHPTRVDWKGQRRKVSR